MFSPGQYIGASLPEKTLCLTFDDGPGDSSGGSQGPKTLRLAEYLAEQDIFATFFMVGKFIVQYPHILPAISRLGHLAGNHTYSHPDMQQHFKEQRDLITEIKRTDELISDWVPNRTIFFRAPYGRWMPEIADQLNQGLDNKYRHIGPFHWDIEGHDWAYWRDGCSAAQAAEAHLDMISKINRGIVLMHDSTADMDNARMSNKTFEMIKILVPQLKRIGYRFVRLDEIPEHTLISLEDIPEYNLWNTCR